MYLLASREDPMRKLVAATLAFPLTVVLSLTASPAHAYHGDRIGRAGGAIAGTCVHNQKSKVLTCIIGTYGYPRIIRGHRIYVRGVRVSVQRCWSGECHGSTKEANLWSPHQIGRASSPAGKRHPDGAVNDVCLEPNLNCGAPWNWLNRNVSRRLQELDNDIVKPCVAGSLGGLGLKVGERTAGQIAAESGLLATGEKAAGVLGPEGYAVAVMTGCFLSIGVGGWDGIQHIAESLNPFDRAGAAR
jgi:hypothetical protein